MQLITSDSARNIPKLYETEQTPTPDKVAHLRLFHPAVRWSWYVIEYDGTDECFGLVVGTETELGYFSVKELEAADWYSVGIERDSGFRPTRLQDIPLYAAPELIRVLT